MSPIRQNNYASEIKIEPVQSRRPTQIQQQAPSTLLTEPDNLRIYRLPNGNIVRGIQQQPSPIRGNTSPEHNRKSEITTIDTISNVKRTN